MNITNVGSGFDATYFGNVSLTFLTTLPIFVAILPGTS